MCSSSRVLFTAIATSFAISASCFAHADQPTAPKYFQAASKTIGAPGVLNADGSYRITIPRRDVRILNGLGMQIPVDLGLNSFAAFSGTSSNALVVGDVAVLAKEVDAVIDALRGGGIDVVGLQVHLTTEKPRLFFVRFQGHGKVADLAAKLRHVFALLGRAAGPVVGPASMGQSSVDWAAIENVLRVHRTRYPSGVMRFVYPRGDAKVTVENHPFTAGMGAGSWAAFHLCTCGRMTVMGETCCASVAELQGVIDALRNAGINISGIHNNVFGDTGQLLFVSFDAEGNALNMAGGIRAAWNVLGPHGPKVALSERAAGAPRAANLPRR
ncbi:MAG: DUF1259 domain-containing protein [Fimbriimonadaceae bacterium]